MKKNHICIILFLFFYTNSFAQITFQNHIIDDASNPFINDAFDVISIDLDNDGDMDVIFTSINTYGAGRIAWFENIDGMGTFGQLQIITSNLAGDSSIYTADIDNDGDIDVLSASEFDDKIAWYENIDGLGTFGMQQIISTNADYARSVYAADVDNDGDIDVLSASQIDDKIAWYENTDGLGTFGVEQIISTNLSGANSVYASDLDNDGDIDVLSASQFDDKIVWYENIDGLGTFGVEQTITTNTNYPESIYVADIDNDGDMDVLSASQFDDKIAWYENTDGLGTFGVQQIITTNADAATSVYAADMDNDGDMDVLSSSSNDNKIVWYENTNGLGTFGMQQIITTNVHGTKSVYAADIDNDGYMDVLSASQIDYKIAWYKNTNGLGNFGEQKSLLINTNFQKANSFNFYFNNSVTAFDIDNDGDMDILSLSDTSLVWIENTDGLGNFDFQGAKEVVTFSRSGKYRISFADIDSDSDIDILLISTLGAQNISLFKNIDGLGTFGPRQFITTGFPDGGGGSVSIADFDGDGDVDIIANPIFGTDINSIGQLRLEWFENTDGLGTFVSHVVSNSDIGYMLYSTDFNDDGNVDILSSSSANNLAWYDNTDGLGNFGAPQIISTNIGAFGGSVSSADFDGDGDIDVLSSTYNNKNISWFENIDGLGTFGSQQQIFTNSINGFTTATPLDIDGDGDMDVLSNRGLFENIDGLGTFNPNFIFGGNEPSPIFPADFDNDGDIDFVYYDTNQSNLGWYENLTNQLSLETFDVQDFIIYPNPVSFILKIKSKIRFDSVVVYDINGKVLKEDFLMFSRLEFEFDVESLTKGMYFIELKSGNIKNVQKFIKQ